MQKEKKDLTIERKAQLKALSDSLKGIRGYITPEDRKAYLESEEAVGRTILSNYLNGKLYSIDTAIRILEFFKDRLDKRAQLIEKLTQ